ncbi:hypothetical protein M0812_22699 [Anaeramoeba flamelloides]|uniref:Rho-GAP domain-containing protein n=1 Tax=Anaeramoeba flamelloides TaxID=1746091 RepID=A0AAV7YVA3_9EUKA|nr:hypothetical protein M0812_22699 [Anaeramoeba flamelloides]
MNFQERKAFERAVRPILATNDNLGLVSAVHLFDRTNQSRPMYLVLLQHKSKKGFLEEAVVFFSKKKKKNEPARITPEVVLPVCSDFHFTKLTSVLMEINISQNLYRFATTTSAARLLSQKFLKIMEDLKKNPLPPRDLGFGHHKWIFHYCLITKKLVSKLEKEYRLAIQKNGNKNSKKSEVSQSEEISEFSDLSNISDSDEEIQKKKNNLLLKDLIFKKKQISEEELEENIQTENDFALDLGVPLNSNNLNPNENENENENKNEDENENEKEKEKKKNKEKEKEKEKKKINENDEKEKQSLNKNENENDKEKEKEKILSQLKTKEDYDEIKNEEKEKEKEKQQENEKKISKISKLNQSYPPTSAIFDEEKQIYETKIEKKMSNVSSDFSLSREYVDVKMIQEMDKYSNWEELKILFVTFNVNDKRPSTEFKKLIAPNKKETKLDLVIVGLQEIDMSPSNILMDMNKSRSKLWVRHVEKELFALSEGGSDWKLIVQEQMVGLFLGIWINKKHLKGLGRSETDFVRCGALKKFGNKGALAAKLQIYDSKIIIINSHLAAHQGNVKKRNHDLKTIFQKLWDGKLIGYNQNSAIYQPDLMFLAGDLNYRIELDHDHVLKNVEEKNYQLLIKNDQLKKEILINKNANLINFKEGEIVFPPSYKFDVGTKNNYDSSKKKRIPAYTDRILWFLDSPFNDDNTDEEKDENESDNENDNDNKNENEDKKKKKKKEKKKTQLVQHYYKSVNSYMFSDHKPVTSLFTFQARKIDFLKKSLYLEKLLGEITEIENNAIAKTEVSTNSIDFGLVQYKIPKIEKLVIKNIGSVVASFAFVCKPEPDPKSEPVLMQLPWLKITPKHGIIPEGSTRTISITLQVNDPKTARRFTLERDELETVLILHLKHGKVHFITISATWEKTCFGLSLSNLINCAEPVSKTSLSQINNTAESNESMLIPKELWLLTDYIWNYGTTKKKLFQQGGDFDEINTIRTLISCTSEQLDSKFSIHSVTEVFLEFIESLYRPIINLKKYKSSIKDTNSNIQSLKLIKKLNPVNYQAFIYLISFGKHLLANSKENNLSLSFVSQIFASIFFRWDKNNHPSQREIEESILLIQNFLLF